MGLIQREKQVVVKVDEITEEPERAGPDGLCVRAGDGEKGELMMVIEDGSGHQVRLRSSVLLVSFDFAPSRRICALAKARGDADEPLSFS